MYYGQEFCQVIDRQHRLFGYELNFWELASKMRIPVIEGSYNSAVYLPSPLITLSPEVYNSLWSFTRFHELSHVVLRDSGIEQQLWEDADCVEQFRAWVEAYCNFGAAQFQMPNPLLASLVDRYGFSPQAITVLARLRGVDLFDAMQRVTFGSMEPDAQRTCLLTQGSYLRKLITTNQWFPHQEGDRIPEVALTMPRAKIMALPERFGRNRALVFLND